MKRFSIVLLILCIVFASGFASYRGYKIWKQKRLVRMARAFTEKGDGANAVLCLRQALASNPNNLDACRMLADFAEAARSPHAVILRSRVLELQPNSITNRLALARAALATGDLPLAEKTLEATPSVDKATEPFHSLAAAVALASRNLDQAEQHFTEAARLAPTNTASKLNLAVLRLHKADPAIRAEARATLQSLAADPVVKLEAYRHLTLDSLRMTNLAAALGFSRSLVQDTNSTFIDRMKHLELLRASKDLEQTNYLASLKTESMAHPPKAYELAKWIYAVEPAAALSYINSLPEATRTNPPVPLVETDCYLTLKQWNTLLTNLSTQSWAEMDCLRLASRARAYKELGSAASAKTEWVAAMKSAGPKRELLLQLLNTVTGWNWQAEQEEVMWALANNHPKEKPIIQALAQRLYLAGRTRSLMTLYGIVSQADRSNLEYANNFAMAAMLLEAWDKKPHELAEEVYTKASTNASFASTYAFSLHLQNKTPEALKVLQSIPAKQLEEPSIGLYYGLVLKASGNAQAAAKYLSLDAKIPLLPEERKLLAKATSGT